MLKTTKFTPAIMLQGTCSNAGKSLLATAICRLLARNGLKVAPFKAQNMSLNSSVTPQGEEIGRAQALQALACGITADARMNPVLLKPTGDCGSQIILMGKPAGKLLAKNFLQKRSQLWPTVCAAYRSLCSEYDCIVLEGAGSPAEINLKAHDIVNMQMAQFAKAHVLLTADIDRGGAFAALLGTMCLLTHTERSYVVGFILNKFRGDPSLLDSALQTLEQKTKRPFFGIVPYIKKLNLPDEDSVSFKLASNVHTTPDSDSLDIALIDLPHLSNTTDFDALYREESVQIRRIQTPEDFGHPHCLILPGTRNTADDLNFLQQTGLFSTIKKYANHCLQENKGMIIGLCGGLQMMGQEIIDLFGLEKAGVTEGLGLLPLTTSLSQKKTLSQRSGQSNTNLTHHPCPIMGYEIHHGQSRFDTSILVPVLVDQTDQALGYGLYNPSGLSRIWGTYVHGIFDSDPFRHSLCARLREEHGLPVKKGCHYDLNQSIDRLADHVECALPLSSILDLLCKKAPLFATFH